MLGSAGGAGAVGVGAAGVGEVRTFLQVTVDGAFANLPDVTSEGDEPAAASGRPGGSGVPFGFYDGSVPPLVSQLNPSSGPCKDGGRWVANLAVAPHAVAAASCASPHAAKRAHGSCVEVSSSRVVSVYGANFAPSPELQCAWGDGIDVRVPATFVSSAEVRCPVPLERIADEGLHRHRRAVVDVSNDGQTWHTSRVIYTYDSRCTPHAHTAWGLLSVLCILFLAASFVGLAWQRASVFAGTAERLRRAFAELERRAVRAAAAGRGRTGDAPCDDPEAPLVAPQGKSERAAKPPPTKAAPTHRVAPPPPSAEPAAWRRRGVLRVTLRRGSLLRTGPTAGPVPYCVRVRAGGGRFVSAARAGEGATSFDGEAFDAAGKLGDFLAQPLGFQLADALDEGSEPLGVGVLELAELLAADALAVEATLQAAAAHKGSKGAVEPLQPRDAELDNFADAASAGVAHKSAEHNLRVPLAPSGTLFVSVRWFDAALGPPPPPPVRSSRRPPSAQPTPQLQPQPTPTPQPQPQPQPPSELAAAERETGRQAERRAAAEAEARGEAQMEEAAASARARKASANAAAGLSRAPPSQMLRTSVAPTGAERAPPSSSACDSAPLSACASRAPSISGSCGPSRPSSPPTTAGASGAEQQQQQPPPVAASRSLAEAAALGDDTTAAPTVSAATQRARASVALDRVGELSVRLRYARGLRGANKDGSSDPYARVLVAGQRPLKTKVAKKTLSPDWNETLTFTGRLGDLCARAMEVQLYNHALLGKHEQLGRVLVELGALLDRDEVDLGELPVPAPGTGVLALSLSFRPSGVGSRRPSLQAPPPSAKPLRRMLSKPIQ
ncbi:hypothetical protein T492DRAFT_165393 [Pavlovales sp. CCMP2436]|nr:hypothetical protein T492DRAFT_165393 [Pavlovales sp. CCMP2436]